MVWLHVATVGEEAGPGGGFRPTGLGADDRRRGGGRIWRFHTEWLRGSTIMAPATLGVECMHSTMQDFPLTVTGILRHGTGWNSSRRS